MPTLRNGQRGTSRRGQVLVVVALVLPAMCGMIGLVLDAGVLLATRRQAQNAADAAAIAAGLARASGQSDVVALATAITYVQSYNGLSGATVTLNSPPVEGGYAGDARYLEVIVVAPTDAWFIPVVGGPSAPTVRTRAVAGPELTPALDSLIALDPLAIPGLSVDRTTVKILGTGWVNSQGAGLDETGAAVNLGYPNYGAQVLNGGVVQADTLRLVSGVDTPGSYQPSSGGVGLKARQLPTSDPFMYLPVPTTANGVSAVYPGILGTTFPIPQNVAIALALGVNYTLVPGIYASITITGLGPGTVTFQPGIYVLQGGLLGLALNIDTGGNVIGNGVMFYNTGTTYDPITGGLDGLDNNPLVNTINTTTGTDLAAIFGNVLISPGTLLASSLTSITDPASPFAGILFYQRRWNTQPVTVRLRNATDNYKGTLYARRAKFTLRDPGTTFPQIIAGSISIVTTSGSASVNIDRGLQIGKANLVFLVE